MKKLGLYILLFVSINILAQAQKMPADTEFYYTYGGVNNDEARDIVEAYDKGYVLVGTTSSFGEGNTSFYIVKTDSLGNHQWSSVQGGSQNDWAYTVQRTKDSCYLVAGYSNSFATSNLNNYSAYYLKIDRSGNLLWQKSLDKGSWSFIYGSCALPDSGFVLCGQKYNPSPWGDADAYLIRIDKNGDTLWTKNYGGNQDELFNSVCVMNNSLYAVGSNSSHPTDGNADGWLVKLDLNGNQIQENFISYADSIQETLNGITPYNDTLFAVCGGALHLDSNTTVGIIHKYDTSLVVTDVIENGANNPTKGSFTQFNKVINTSYGSICTIGVRNGGAGGFGVYFLGTSKYNGYINGFSPIEGGPLDDYGYKGIYTSSGRIVTIGSTYSFGDGGDDMLLIRFDSDSIANFFINYFIGNNYTDTLSLSEVSIKKYEENILVNLYPNPSNNLVHLKVQNTQTQNYTAKVYSVLGEEITSFKITSNTDNTLDFSTLNAGNYFLHVEQNNQPVSVLHFVIDK